MEAVVNQTLSDVINRHPSVFGDASDVDDAFVGNQPFVARIKKREMIL